MTIKPRLILFALLFIAVQLSFGQGTDTKETEKVATVIKELFDGYRAGDSSRVRAVFTADAHAQTILASANDKDKLSDLLTIDNFIKYIGGGLAEVHDERLWETQIFTDSQLATVWTRYAFFLDKKFIHCGTETFLLRKVNQEWKIYYLVDTRKTTGCKLPGEIKK